MKISESIVYVISQLFFRGQGNCKGRRQNKILPKFSPKLAAKFWVHFVSSKFYQNRNTTKNRRSNDVETKTEPSQLDSVPQTRFYSFIFATNKIKRTEKKYYLHSDIVEEPLKAATTMLYFEL